MDISQSNDNFKSMFFCEPLRFIKVLSCIKTRTIQTVFKLDIGDNSVYPDSVSSIQAIFSKTSAVLVTIIVTNHTEMIMAKDTTQPTFSNPEAMLQIMMAEHAALQSARSSTIFDATGRANLYIGSISSVLVALAFIGQASEMDQSFFIFALLLLIPLFFIGMTTFHRVIQIGNADTIYTRGINRIRHFYTQIAPDTEPYFILPTRDDFTAVTDELGGTGVFQTFLSTPGLVNGLNSVLVGVFIGVLLHLVFDLTLLVCVIVGIIGFVISVYLHTRYLGMLHDANQRRLKVMFPSPEPPTS
jgi:hypothetical protein